MDRISRKTFLQYSGAMGMLALAPELLRGRHTDNFTKKAFLQEFNNIISFWQKYAPDKINGGFIGAANREGKPNYNADKGIVLYSRILWTFARAMELEKNSSKKAAYQRLCERALAYINQYFWDKTNGGVYWSVTAQGTPAETRKLMYGHSFCVYGASEYARVSGSKLALQLAQDTFNQIVSHAYDAKNGGYIEAYGSAWQEIDDYILSRGDARKSMNTQLHLLECFANLYKVDKSERVRFHLAHSLDMMMQHIIGPGKNRMTLFFTENWEPRSEAISYGHDIEASWLVYEAAEILGDQAKINSVKNTCLQMAVAAADGIQADGGMIYEIEPHSTKGNFNRDWWVQAEAMVGFMNAYRLSGQAHFLDKAKGSWKFIQEYIIDHEKGEWYTGVNPSHIPTSTEKINLWKCPYHNGRACLEMIARL